MKPRSTRLVLSLLVPLFGLLLPVQIAGATDPTTPTVIPYGPRCQKLRAKSAAAGSSVNDMVVYCPVDFPLAMHCGTLADEAPLDKTIMSTTNKNCASTGKCSAVQLRKAFGPQNQATELVQAVPDSDTAPGITGCWVYDFDHTHLPYVTEVICCKR
jgi:hypothetical protein